MNILEGSPAFIDETNRDQNDAHRREEKWVFGMKEVDMVIWKRLGHSKRCGRELAKPTFGTKFGVDSGDQAEACKPSGSSLIRTMSTPSRILYPRTRSSENMALNM